MLSSLLLLLAAEAAAVPAPPANLGEPEPSAMSPKEIREFNAQVPHNHRWYIRCVSSLETASLVKANKTCRTNEQWRRTDERGNDNARDTYDSMGKVPLQPQL